MYVKEKIIYSNVWEDPELNRLALKINPSDTVLSITSGGCNSLNLLLEEPAKLISIDCNRAQLYLLELKKTAISHLNFPDFIKLLGVEYFNSESSKPAERLDIYRKIRDLLSLEAKAFWDRDTRQIEDGIIFCGAVEKFFKFYRTLLGLFYPGRDYEKIFFTKNMDDQIRLVSAFPKGRWRFINRLLLNRKIISLVKGRHSLKYVSHSHLDRNLNSKIHRSALQVPLKSNYFLALILLGSFVSEADVPPYLLEKNFEKLKNNIQKLEIRFGTLADIKKIYGQKSIDKFNLSNIMEWMNETDFSNLIRDVLDLAKEKAIFCYRYTLADAQKIPDDLQTRISYKKELSEKLFAMDRSFMYESFHVYELNENIK